MKSASALAKIKLFISSHLVPVIATSSILVVGVSAGVVAIIINSQPKQEIPEISDNSQEVGKEEKEPESSDNAEEKSEDNSSEQDKSDNSASTTQNQNSTSSQPKPTEQPSSSNSNSNNSNSNSSSPTTPNKPSTPTRPTTPTDNRVWGVKPYFYKENGVYYCPDGTREEEPFNYVDCSTQDGGCGYPGEIPEGYKFMYCYVVPEDF